MRGFIGVLLGVLMSVKMAQGQVFSEDFKSIDPLLWSVADYEFSHPAFDTDWSRNQLSVNKGLQLTLSPQHGAKNRYLGASLRRTETSGFGRYETILQAGRGTGVVSGFFTYTGPYYGTRHDEIDIEFLGKNTRQIHIALFVGGQLWNKFIDLDFDAAERPRRYGFDWQPDAVRWYVDDGLIYERTAADGPIPQVPGYLFVNIWAADPSIANWAGLAGDKLRAQARVMSVSHRGAGF